MAATIATPSPFLEGLTTQEMIDETLGLLGAAPGDYNRYDQTAVLRALNLGGLRFAKQTSCLTMPVIVLCKANQQNYRLPYGVLRVLNARYYTSASATDYWELEVLRSAGLMQKLDAQYRGTLGIPPEYLFPTYKAGNIVYVGVSPVPTVDGQQYNYDPRYGILTGATDITMAGNITGTHKDTYPGSAFLVDTDGRDLLTLGAAPGMQVFNVTQGIAGVITAFTTHIAQNDTIVATMASLWDADDSFSVLVAEYGAVVDSDGQTTGIPSYLGTTGDLLPPGEGNLAMDVARKPMLLTADAIDAVSEIPVDYQEAQIAYAVFKLGSRMFKGVVQSDKAEKGLAQFNAMVLEYNADEQYVEESNREIEYHEDF